MSLLTPEQLAKSNTEHAHQVALFAWAASMFATYWELRLLFAIPNGGLRDKITAAKLKAEGVKAGVSDLFFPVPRGKWHGLFIEMKKPGEKATPQQVQFITDMQKLGYAACVCVGWEVARDVLLAYLNCSEK